MLCSRTQHCVSSDAEATDHSVSQVKKSNTKPLLSFEENFLYEIVRNIMVKMMLQTVSH